MILLLLYPSPCQSPLDPSNSSVYRRQTEALREPACTDGGGILLRGWELWFPFKNQIASIFCPKGVCYNFCSTKGQFSFLLSSVVIMCVCKWFLGIGRKKKPQCALCLPVWETEAGAAFSSLAESQFSYVYNQVVMVVIIAIWKYTMCQALF